MLDLACGKATILLTFLVFELTLEVLTYFFLLFFSKTLRTFDPVLSVYLVN